MKYSTSRLRRAGSAYLEALVLLPLFAVICLCALALGGTYDAQLLAVQRAREAAWRETASGCDREESSMLERAQALAADDARDPLSGLTSALFAPVTLERHAGQARRAEAGLASEARTFRAVTQRACNEVPPAATQRESARAGAVVERLMAGGR